MYQKRSSSNHGSVVHMRSYRVLNVFIIGSCHFGNQDYTGLRCELLALLQIPDAPAIVTILVKPDGKKHRRRYHGCGESDLVLNTI